MIRHRERGRRDTATTFLNEDNNNKQRDYNNKQRDLQETSCTDNEVRSALNDPCTENHVTTYLRRSDVREALHVSDSHSWKSCSSGSYAYTESVLNLYVVFES